MERMNMAIHISNLKSQQFVMKKIFPIVQP